MTNGTISSLRDRGFGFIAPDGADRNNELFFHRSSVAEDGFSLLREGQRVQFEQEPDARDPSRQRATGVSPIGDEASS